MINQPSSHAAHESILVVTTPSGLEEHDLLDMAGGSMFGGTALVARNSSKPGQEFAVSDSDSEHTDQPSTQQKHARKQTTVLGNSHSFLLSTTSAGSLIYSSSDSSDDSSSESGEPVKTQAGPSHGYGGGTSSTAVSGGSGASGGGGGGSSTSGASGSGSRSSAFYTSRRKSTKSRLPSILEGRAGDKVRELQASLLSERTAHMASVRESQRTHDQLKRRIRELKKKVAALEERNSGLEARCKSSETQASVFRQIADDACHSKMALADSTADWIDRLSDVWRPKRRYDRSEEKQNQTAIDHGTGATD